MKYIKIGELAREVGLCPETIRLAEKQGRIPPARRTPGGWGVWGEEDLDKLKEVLLKETR